MMRLPTLTALACLAPLGALAGDAVEVNFVDHIKAEMVEQDVFVMKGGTDVFRVTTADYGDFLAEPVYAAATGIEHAPMDMSMTGPFAAGGQLGFTLGDWLSATGKASIDCHDNKGAISAEFQNLVPNGLYTMWHFFVGIPFPPKFHTYDMPLGARDGSQAGFTADGSGHAAYSVEFEPCLQGGGSQLGAGLAIAYHSDGKTYGWNPGSMGDKSHVHLFTLLPGDGDMPH